jgi:hypothetical protein
MSSEVTFECLPTARGAITIMHFFLQAVVWCKYYTFSHVALLNNLEKCKQGQCPKIALEFPIGVQTGTSLQLVHTSQWVALPLNASKLVELPSLLHGCAISLQWCGESAAATE